MHRIHVVGCGPRSGTTLMFELIKTSFEVDLHGEHETSIYSWPKYRANVFLTKKPMDIMVVEPVLKRVPALHVVYMIRDPRDMCVSKHGSDPERYWSSLTFWKTYTPFGRRLQGHPRFITIRYEDLVTEPDRVQNFLLERLPFLMKRSPFSRFHQTANPPVSALHALNGLRPISASSLGRWRQHLPRVVAQLKRHGALTGDLIEYGYETDSQWETELAGVTPDFSPSHWPEYFPQKILRKIQHRKRLGALWAVFGHSDILLALKGNFTSSVVQ